MIRKHDLRVVGAHCYLGGFLIGLMKAGMKVLATGESWKPGLKGAKLLGLPTVPLQDVRKKKATIVVGNPPCSRFSHLSLSFFKGKRANYEDLETYPEVLDLIDLTKAAGASILWWETGPLSWKLGKYLIFDIQRRLNEFWGDCYSLLVRLDLRYLGIPQRRPRVHIFHIKGPPTFLPKIPQSTPLIETAKSWLSEKTYGFPLKQPVIIKGVKNPLNWAYEKKINATFRAMVPKVISSQDVYICAVISRRMNIWEEENRFFDILEYAALMTYPLDKINKLTQNIVNPMHLQVLLSKSVAPIATERLANDILLPILEKNGENRKDQYLKRDGLYYLDLSHKDKYYSDGLNQIPLSF